MDGIPSDLNQSSRVRASGTDKPPHFSYYVLYNAYLITTNKKRKFVVDLTQNRSLVTTFFLK